MRHLQVLLLFLALTVGFTTRVNLSVAIVAMTELPVMNSVYIIFPNVCTYLLFNPPRNSAGQRR